MIIRKKFYQGVLLCQGSIKIKKDKLVHLIINDNVERNNPQKYGDEDKFILDQYAGW